MKEWTNKEFVRVLTQNGFLSSSTRGKGSHTVYVNSHGKHISIPLKIAAPIARRLIKENNLKV